MSLTPRRAIELYLRTAPLVVAVETVRAHTQEAVGYYVSGTTVSRIMGTLGWARESHQGKIHFRQPDSARA